MKPCILQICPLYIHSDTYPDGPNNDKDRQLDLKIPHSKECC